MFRRSSFDPRRHRAPSFVCAVNHCSNTAMRSVGLPTMAVEEMYAKLDPEEETRKAFRLFDDDGLGKVLTKGQPRSSIAVGNWWP